MGETQIPLIQTLTEMENNVSAKFEQYRIVIDPGHGGSDFGAAGEFSYEKDINLFVARMLRDRLMFDHRFLPILTRHKDEYLGLSSRTKITIDKNPHMFISIHSNAFTSEKPNGSQVYFYDEDKDKPLASIIYNNIKLLHKAKPSKWSGVRFGNFSVLRKLKNYPTIPCILVEMGFISNIDDEKRLNDHGFQEDLVEGVYKGLKTFFALK